MCSAGAKSNRQSFMCEPRDRTPPAASRHGQLTEVSVSWLAFRHALLHYIHIYNLYHCDFSFLDAQTENMNSMKMAMKTGTEFSSNSQENSTIYTVERGGYLYP